MSTVIGSATALSIERGVRVAMPDGVTLATDVVRPQTSEPVPALLLRTPYGRDPGSAADPADAIRLVEAGYALVTQDVRGRFDSGGTFSPFRDEPGDGVATIAWLAAQPWCKGKVGLMGGSYVGATQWLAAGQAPPNLSAFVPYATGSDYHEGWTYQGGAFQLGFILRWTIGSLSLAHLPGRPDADPAALDGLARAYAAIDDGYLHRPLADVAFLDTVAPYYREWLEHQARDGWWREVAPRERYAAVTAPALNIGGWYDIFVGGTVENYRGLRDGGGSPDARSGTRLIVGPWSHSNETRTYPERTYGWGAELDALDPTALHLRFFDRWLRGVDNGIDREPPVRLFVMGADRWQDEADWPPPDAELRPWFLHSTGRAGLPGGDGTLSAEPPGEEPADTYRYDPNDPVPSMGGATLMPGGRPGWNDGPWDQRSLAGRADILRFASAPLDRPVGVIGDVEVVLHAASSARDTDFTARLIDVQPDGREEILAEGILRARYRESLAEARLLEPGSIVELRIRVGPTANVFRVGHRIRVDVSSSSFPRFDPNLNTGGDPASEPAGDAVIAENTVFHDRRHPSHVLLPVVDRDWRLG